MRIVLYILVALAASLNAQAENVIVTCGEVNTSRTVKIVNTGSGKALLQVYYNGRMVHNVPGQYEWPSDTMIIDFKSDSISRQYDSKKKKWFPKHEFAVWVEIAGNYGRSHGKLEYEKTWGDRDAWIISTLIDCK